MQEILLKRKCSKTISTMLFAKNAAKLVKHNCAFSTYKMLV